MTIPTQPGFYWATFDLGENNRFNVGKRDTPTPVEVYNIDFGNGDTYLFWTAPRMRGGKLVTHTGVKWLGPITAAT